MLLPLSLAMNSAVTLTTDKDPLWRTAAAACSPSIVGGVLSTSKRSLSRGALRRLFELRRRAALGDHHAGNIGRRRHLQSHICRLARRNDCLALCAHARILKDDSIDDWRDVARQIRETDPIDAVARASIVDDGLPLCKPRRGRFHRAARFRIRAVPAGPFAARSFAIAGAVKKCETTVV